MNAAGNAQAHALAVAGVSRDPGCPFRATTPSRQGLIGRLLRRPHPAAARVALRNLIVAAWPDPPSPDAAAAVFAAHRIARGEQRTLGTEIIHDLFTDAVARGGVRPTDTARIARIKTALHLSDVDVQNAESEVLGPALRAQIQSELTRGPVSESTRTAIEAAADRLGASESLHSSVIAAELTRFTGDWYRRLVESRRISPQDFLGFTAGLKALGINAKFEPAAEAELRYCARLWRIENGELPPIATSLHLQRAEECYYEAPARWLEHRRHSQTVGYSSSGMSFRVTRGVYYRVGATRPQRVVTEGLEQVDAGTVYITSKRVVFSGAVKNFTITLNSLVAFHAFSDGFALEKGSGKHPHILLGRDAEEPLLLLSRLLAS